MTWWREIQESSSDQTCILSEVSSQVSSRELRGCAGIFKREETLNHFWRFGEHDDTREGQEDGAVKLGAHLK